MKAALIGGGVTGAGWAARFLLGGWDVAVFDPDPETARRLAEVLANARAALPALSDGPMPPEGRLHIATSIADACAGADHVQESVGVSLPLKQRVLAEIRRAAPGVTFGSSISGFSPASCRRACRIPARSLSPIRSTRSICCRWSRSWLRLPPHPRP